MQFEQTLPTSYQVVEAGDNSISKKADTSSSKRGDGFYFAGFKSPNYTPIPDEFFDLLAPRLSEAELRVLLYIMRRTFGFKKQADAISLSQLTGGIRKRNGEVQDTGTGLSKPAALKGIAGLQEKGIIVVEKSIGEDGRNEINIYRLRYADEQPVTTSKSLVSQPLGYSTIEYSSKDFNLFPSPDLRPAPSPPPPPVISKTETTGRERWGRVGAAPPVSVNENNPLSSDNQGVNSIYPVSKANLLQSSFAPSKGKSALPMSISATSHGKETLPSRVNHLNPGSKVSSLETVKQITPQHGNLQKNMSQETANNKPSRNPQDGNLAIKMPEAVVVDITEKDLLDQECEEIAVLLTGYGFSRKTVAELIAKWPLDYLRQKIYLTEDLRHRNPVAVRNLPGFLRQAIAEDYQPIQTHRLASTKPERPAASRYRRVSGPGTTSSSSGKLACSPGSSSSVAELYRERKNLSSGASGSNSAQVYDPQRCALLWENVCAALADRFRRPDLANKLKLAKLEIKASTRQAEIKLGRNWPASLLLSTDRALLQMAFSQEVGPGYHLEVREEA